MRIKPLMIHVCQIPRPAQNPSSSYYYRAYSCLLLINLVCLNLSYPIVIQQGLMSFSAIIFNPL